MGPTGVQQLLRRRGALAGLDGIHPHLFRHFFSHSYLAQGGSETNLMQLTVDTSYWTRYRSRTQNPDFGDTFPPAIPGLTKGKFPAIPRNDTDPAPDVHIQAIASTAGFHFGYIEQGGSSLYPTLAQGVTNLEVLRILLSIGPTETAHFQTWHDKAGNAPALTDPTNGLVFPDLNAAPFGGQTFQTNLIMPEPTVFLSRKFPPVSIIRPTQIAGSGGAVATIKSFTADGLFIGQPPEFFALLHDLAVQADAARRSAFKLVVDAHEIDKVEHVNESCNEPDNELEGAQVHTNELVTIGTLDFDRNRLAGGGEDRFMDLAERGGSSTFAFQHAEYILDGLAQLRLNDRHNMVKGRGWHLVLQ